jgi:3-isopropylmalate/(R)-2-methylmalate dehydratase large subunit
MNAAPPQLRVFYLCANATAVQQQLAGEVFTLDTAPALRDDLSTDEITPAWTCLFSDERIGDYVYLGLRCELPCDGDLQSKADFPVRQQAVRRAQFKISVAGWRRGKGSSRESSPYAELAAGIRMVFARSFERIYRQNCQNLGLLTSTDFDLLARIERGEPWSANDFIDGLDPVSAEVVRAGGLLAYTRKRLAGALQAPARSTPARPMTYAEKMIARAVVIEPVVAQDPTSRPTIAVAAAVAPVAPGDSVFVRCDWRFSYDVSTPLAMALLRHALGAQAGVRDPDSVVFFRDHMTFMDQVMPASQRAMGLLDTAHELGRVQRRFAEEQGIKLHAELPDRIGSEGICHSIMAERYASPGQIVVGTDSHTPHCGALGALAFGVGTTEMANAWITTDVRLCVPACVQVNLHGVLAAGLSAKDVVLGLLRLPFFRSGGAVGRIIEFSGPVVRAMNTDERATLTNMVAELGGFTGIVVPDAETTAFLRARRGVDWVPESWMHSDAHAVYEHRLDFNCSELVEMVAAPGDPGNGTAINALAAPVPIQIAYGGSCTGGKREDLVRYHEVLAWAERHGRRIADGVTFYLQFGSVDVRRWCEANGMVETFNRLGVQLVEPGCGACINAGPGASTQAEQVTISAINRNFPGRSGPGSVWLGSPATVAASAIAGHITSFAELQRSSAVKV